MWQILLVQTRIANRYFSFGVRHPAVEKRKAGTKDHREENDDAKD